MALTLQPNAEPGRVWAEVAHRIRCEWEPSKLPSSSAGRTTLNTSRAASLHWPPTPCADTLPGLCAFLGVYHLAWFLVYSLCECPCFQPQSHLIKMLGARTSTDKGMFKFRLGAASLWGERPPGDVLHRHLRHIYSLSFRGAGDCGNRPPRSAYARWHFHVHV